MRFFSPDYFTLFLLSAEFSELRLQWKSFLVLNLFQDPETSSGLERLQRIAGLAPKTI